MEKESYMRKFLKRERLKRERLKQVLLYIHEE
jgi:uncharacterized protein YpiB (UPF0302 family)